MLQIISLAASSLMLSGCASFLYMESGFYADHGKKSPHSSLYNDNDSCSVHGTCGGVNRCDVYGNC